MAYKGATPDVQNKVRRVVEVWRDRSVFEGPIQTAIESRIDGMPNILTLIKSQNTDAVGRPG